MNCLIHDFLPIPNVMTSLHTYYIDRRDENSVGTTSTLPSPTIVDFIKIPEIGTKVSNVLV